MITRFNFFDKTLHLERYPIALQHQSWQAWDSADEFIIEHVETHIADWHKCSIAIFNDDFGSLACWFQLARLQWISDSFVSTTSCQINLAKNHLKEDGIQFQDCLQPLEQVPDLVLIKIPKTIALLEHQLIQLQASISENTMIIAAGKAKAIQKSTLALFEKYLGPTKTSLAQKKSRLIFCQPTGDKHSDNPYPTKWDLNSPTFTIQSHANVFARQQLDIGARFLLEHLPDCQHKTVVDLGCGNGVIGLHILHKYPDAKVVFVDESFMAVESARINVQHNLSDALPRSRFIVSNCLDKYSASDDFPSPDAIVCNPPFHQQNAITDHIAYQMFKDSLNLLVKGGELRVIGNRHLDYPKKLKRMFGGFDVVATNSKFSILSAVKR